MPEVPVKTVPRTVRDNTDCLALLQLLQGHRHGPLESENRPRGCGDGRWGPYCGPVTPLDFR